MPLQDSVKSLMNPGVISVLSNTPVLVAIDIILSNRFNGLPVTDKEGVLIGIVTKYDLILKRANIRDDTKVGEVMNEEPLTLHDNATVENAITAFAEHHRVDPIPVLNDSKKVIGIISRADMVLLFKEYGVDLATEQGFSKTYSKPQTGYSSVIWILLSVVIIGALYYFLFLR